MTSFLAQLKTTILGPAPASQSFTKVSIVGEGDDFESDKALLLHLSEPPINRYVPDPDSGASAHASSNRQYRPNLRLGYLGIVDPKRWLAPNGLPFSDSDAFNPYICDVLKDCLQLSAKRIVNSNKPKDLYSTVMKEIP